jgi:transcriptional regulator with XRE-family HTH domain
VTVLFVAAVGERICDIRTSRGWTQLRLADAIGTTQNNISRWERGLRTINIAQLADIAAVLHAPLSDFFPNIPTTAKPDAYTLNSIADQLDTITATIRESLSE